jgi:hypothetical protein
LSKKIHYNTKHVVTTKPTQSDISIKRHEYADEGREGGGGGRGCGFSSLMKKTKKAKNALSFASPEKEKYTFLIMK